MNELANSLLTQARRCRATVRRDRAVMWCLPLMIVVVGCGSNLPKLYPVAGTVTLDGDPLVAGHVSLYRIGGGGSTNRGIPSGIIQDGKYEIFTGKRSGVSEGRYKVVVTATNYSGGNAPPMGGTAVPVRSLIDAKYGTSSQTPLTLDVVPEPDAGFYDLKVTKPSRRRMR